MTKKQLFLLTSLFLAIIISLLIISNLPFYLSVLSIAIISNLLLFLGVLVTKANAKKPSLDTELTMAKRVQEALLSVAPPSYPGINIIKRCIPATSLGGDFYTFIGQSGTTITEDPSTPGIIKYENTEESGLGIAIGDVAGHGISSALVMALSSGLLDKIGQQYQSPSTILEKANNDIQKFIKNSQISHLTAMYAIYNPINKTLTYANAGHPEGYILKKEGTLLPLPTTGTLLGLYENENYSEKTLKLNTHDRIILFTDGIFEGQNTEKESFGTDRLERLLKENNHLPIDSLLELIYTKIKEFSKDTPTKDDQTLIIAEVN